MGGGEAAGEGGAGGGEEKGEGGEGGQGGGVEGGPEEGRGGKNKARETHFWNDFFPHLLVRTGVCCMGIVRSGFVDLYRLLQA